MTDRLIQLVALATIVIALATTMLLTPSINQMRVDRQLTYDTVAGDAVNPQYTLLASTGSFRGIAVNVLWYRIEKLKNEGKFAEANTLARMIVSLQPRFPGAWEFMAWNMAYNISVQCNTPEERWYWVNNGLKLLRDEGIPNNPRSIQLYRQLSWIFSHKIGGRTDDKHWYYKREFANEWESVLFEPLRRRSLIRVEGEPEVAENRWHELMPSRFEWDAIRQFRDVDTAAQTYLRKPEGEGAGDDVPWSPEHYFAVLTPEVQARFFKDYPELEGVVTQLQALRGEAGEELGLGLNAKTLRAFGRIMMYRRSGYNISNDPTLQTREVLGADTLAVLQFLQDAGSEGEPTAENPAYYIEDVPRSPSVNAPDAPPFERFNGHPGIVNLTPLLDLLRAQTLVSEYHMDPGFMMWLMEEYGPLDWRHVNSHALYWSSLGTIMALDNHNRSQIDFINNDRQTLHAVQGLAYAGTLIFRPVVPALGELGEGVIQTMVDTRFFEAYDKALARTRGLIDADAFGDVKENTYDTGYENFLHSAIMYSYFGGQTGLARYYFQKVKDEYAQPGSRSSYLADYVIYENNLPGFAHERLFSDDMFDSKVGYLSQLLDRAWREGLVLRDPQVSARYLLAARQFYDKIQEDYNSSPIVGNTGTQNRMDLADLRKLVIESFLLTFLDPSFSIPERASFWVDAASLITDLPMRYEIYLRMSGPLTSQMQQQGIDAHVSEFFAMPPGFMEWYEAQRQQNEQEQNNNADPTLSNN